VGKSGDQHDFTNARLIVQPAGCFQRVLDGCVGIRRKNDLTRVQCGARIRRKPELSREVLRRDAGTAVHPRDEDTIEPSLIKQVQRQLDAVILSCEHNGGGRQIGCICGYHAADGEFANERDSQCDQHDRAGKDQKDNDFAHRVSIPIWSARVRFRLIQAIS